MFFGRETAADQVLKLMSQRLDGASLLVVSGASGAGKSSLVRAGILPRLREAGLISAPEAARWPCLLLTPGPDPLNQLAVGVAPLAGADAAAVRQGLAADPNGFALTARQAALAQLDTATQDQGALDATAQCRLLLVVDQFEQLFTLCKNEQERRSFITALHAAATSRHGDRQLPSALVVLVVRADFELRLAGYPQLTDAVQHRYLLTAMTERQLRMAITGPAAKAGSTVDAELVQVLLDEVGTHASRPADGYAGPAIGAGVLPLLSYALDQAWRTRAGPALTLADYERTGGIESAVGSSAQRAYEQLTPAQQDAARRIFTRLTTTSVDGRDTAARVARGDLVAGLGVSQTRDVEVVLETFTARRLLTLGADTVEISHEALLTAWPLLRDTWLAETHADRIVRARLQLAAQEWAAAAFKPDYLYGGSRLQTAQDAGARIDADGRQARLSATERDFLRASSRADRRRARRRREVMATLMALVVGLAVLAVIAFRANQASAVQRDNAISAQLAGQSLALGDTNATAAKLESIAAWSIDPTVQANYAMLAAAARPQIATIAGPGLRVDSVAVRPNGKLLATGGDSGAVRIWNLATLRQVGRSITGHLGPVSWLAFSPDGTLLAFDSYFNGLILWDLVTHKQVAKFSGSHLAFSPDGKVLAVADSGDGEVLLWSLATHRSIGGPLYVGTSKNVAFASLAFSPDSRVLAVGNIYSDTVQFWNVATRKVTWQLRNVRATSPVFSPNGGPLAVIASDGAVQLWDVATRRSARKPIVVSGAANSLAFSPDGTVLAVGGTAGAAWLLNPVTGQQVGSVVTGDPGTVSVAFIPGNSTLVTSVYRGPVRLWDATLVAGQQIGSPIISPDKESIQAAAFSPNGILATSSLYGMARWDVTAHRQVGSFIRFDSTRNSAEGVAFNQRGTMLADIYDGSVQLWDVATGRLVGSFSVGTVNGILAFNQSGTIVAVNIEGEVALWDVATHRLIEKLSYKDKDAVVDSLAFSPDATMVAAGESDGKAVVWNVATHRLIATLATRSKSVNSVAFSPDGADLATGDADGEVLLWNMRSRTQAADIVTGNAAINSVVFSRDGTVMATGGYDGTARLWDVATGQQIGTALTIEFGSVMTFSPDDRTLVTTGFGGAARWDVGYISGVLSRLCSQVGGKLTSGQWTRYVPPGPSYRDACVSR